MKIKLVALAVLATLFLTLFVSCGPTLSGTYKTDGDEITFEFEGDDGEDYDGTFDYDKKNNTIEIEGL